MHTGTRKKTTAALLCCGLIGAVLFLAVMLVLGVAKPGYSAVRNTVSSGAIGTLGWVQVASFIVTGLLMVAYAVGLRLVLAPSRGGRWGPLAVGAFGVGLVAAGVFVTDPDPVDGRSPPTSPHGALHDVASLVVFAAVTVACFVLARRFAPPPRRWGWLVYSVFSGVAVPVLLVAAVTALNSAGGWAVVAGLLQRLSIVAGWGWLAALAVMLLRESVRGSESEPCGPG